MVDFGLKMAYCCCFDLRTAGLVIGSIQMIFCLLTFLWNITTLTFGTFLIYAFFLGVHGCWIYGIHKESTIFMLPGLICELVAYALCLLVLVLILTVGLAMGSTISKFIPDPNVADQVANLYQWGTGIIIFFFIIFAFIAALQWLYTAVKYSLYMEMKEANGSNVESIECDNFATIVNA